MIWIAVQLSGAALAAWGGHLAARRSRKAAAGTIAALLGVVLIKNALCCIPAGEPRLLPWNWYPFVERWWYLIPAMGIFGAGITVFRASVWRRDVLLVGAGVLLLRCAALGWVLSRPSDLLGAADAEGVCHQTSGYSCTAASAVMLLHRHGVAATEREMAELSLTCNGAGTTDSGLMRGLRLKLGGRRTPRIDCPTYATMPTPSIVGLRLSRSLAHSIVVVQAGPTELKVLDPLYGKGTLPRWEFERDWLGTAIWIE